MAIVAHEKGRVCPECGFGNSQRSNKCVVCGHGLPKHRNVKVKLDGYTFDSKKEADHYLVLLMRQKMKEITRLEVHPRFKLEVNGEKVGTYVGDFSYIKNGKVIVEDVKSRPTSKLQTYRIKKKLLKSCFGIDIVEIMGE